MATTTTNYGFDVPTSSDLVKNGATQIALLGQDLDTFLFRPFTRNYVNNGSFDIWQRGTSISAIANDQAYSADRWRELNNAGLSTYSRQSTNDTTNLPSIQYCMRVQRNSGQTATGIIYVTQSLESVNSIPLAGRTVTFSFYARAGSNYSATSNILSVTVNSGTGTDQNINQGLTGSASVVSQNATLTTTWQRFTYTGSVASTATQLGYFFSYTPTGTASTNDYFEVTGVQLEMGSQASPFIRQGVSIQGELAMCQRYYYRLTGSAYLSTPMGLGQSATAANIPFPNPTTLRTVATSVGYTGAGVFSLNDSVNSITFTSASIDAGRSTPQVTWLALVVSGATAFRPYWLQAGNNSSAFIEISAEL
jgi:hypothetical protein